MSAPLTSLPVPELCGRRVLLVDDNRTQLKLNRLRLEDAGFAVETATGAVEALELACRRPPDAIVSDVIMGEVDGFTLLRRVRAQPSLVGVPVLLLSAHFEGKHDPELARQLGAAGLVQRTGDFGKELSALCAALSAPRAPQEVREERTYERLLRSTARQMSRLVDRAARSEERYRTLLHNASDAITLLTPDGIIVEANERWRSLLGIDPKELVGKHIREFGAPGSEQTHEAGYRDCVALESASSGPVPIRHADGHVVQMEFSVTVSEVGGEPIVLSIGRDVTERVRAHAELAAAEEKYRTLVERMPDVIWTMSENAEVTFITRNVEHVFGHTQAELCGRSLDANLQEIHPEDRVLVRDAIVSLRTRGAPFDIEYRRRHKQGHWVWVRNRAAGSYERDGVRYFDGILSDVTDRKRLEESLLHAQKLEAIGQLTGGIAHDFNNVLAAILANSHFLLEALAEQDPRRADAEEVKVAAERAATLTRQLLAFSRKQVLEPSTVSLSGIVSGIEKMLQRLIGEDIELAVDGNASTGKVRVDVGQIEQVIVNLAVNARDAMPHGGKIAITTADVDLTDPKAAADAAVPAGRYVRITVRDNGSGMNAETKTRLFEPFFTTKGPGRGTGLGLSTCYGIVKQSGGFIAVQSELGQGTTFVVHLPQVDAAEVRALPKAEQMELDGWETLLLIEDDVGVRGAVRRMLERRGYRVLVASDGADAISFVRTHEGPIDLVLSDVVMPGGSGPEIVERLREHTGATKALFMSGYTAHAALPVGVDDSGIHYIQKPFSPEALAKKVRQVLSE